MSCDPSTSFPSWTCYLQGGLSKSIPLSPWPLVAPSVSLMFWPCWTPQLLAGCFWLATMTQSPYPQIPLTHRRCLWVRAIRLSPVLWCWSSSRLWTHTSKHTSRWWAGKQAVIQLDEVFDFRLPNIYMGHLIKNEPEIQCICSGY